MADGGAFSGFVCEDCGVTQGVVTGPGCERCGGSVSARYDYGRIERIATDRPDIWAYAALLPRTEPPWGSLGTGGTPLIDCPTLADRVGLRSLAIKDEGRNPTGSWADRMAALLVAGASDVDQEEVALPSPGDDGQSVAAYAARAAFDASVYVPSRTGFVRKAMINVHGADMRVVRGGYADALAAHREALDAARTIDAAPGHPDRIQAAKTILFELLDDDTLPEAIVCPVGTGELPASLAEGAAELLELGRIDQMPRLFAVQPAGCAPIVDAIESGATHPEPVETPDTVVGELEIAAPVRGQAAIAAVRESGGRGVRIEDDVALSAGSAVASRTGVEVGLAGAVGAAGVDALADSGDLDPVDRVAVINTGAGNKDADLLRSFLMSYGL